MIKRQQCPEYDFPPFDDAIPEAFKNCTFGPMAISGVREFSDRDVEWAKCVARKAWFRIFLHISRVIVLLSIGVALVAVSASYQSKSWFGFAEAGFVFFCLACLDFALLFVFVPRNRILIKEATLLTIGDQVLVFVYHEEESNPQPVSPLKVHEVVWPARLYWVANGHYLLRPQLAYLGRKRDPHIPSQIAGYFSSPHDVNERPQRRELDEKELNELKSTLSQNTQSISIAVWCYLILGGMTLKPFFESDQYGPYWRWGMLAGVLSFGLVFLWRSRNYLRETMLISRDAKAGIVYLASLRGQVEEWLPHSKLLWTIDGTPAFHRNELFVPEENAITDEVED